MGPSSHSNHIFVQPAHSVLGASTNQCPNLDDIVLADTSSLLWLKGRPKRPRSWFRGWQVDERSIGVHCLRCEARQNAAKVVAGELGGCPCRAACKARSRCPIPRRPAAPRSSSVHASTANIHSESRRLAGPHERAGWSALRVQIAEVLDLTLLDRSFSVPAKCSIGTSGSTRCLLPFGGERDS
jgi:hypothetical protein